MENNELQSQEDVNVPEKEALSADGENEESYETKYLIDKSEASNLLNSIKAFQTFFKWAIAAIVALMIGFIGTVITLVVILFVKYDRDYNQTVSAARDASNEARQYAQNAQGKSDSIDQLVTDKLREIEEKGNKLVDKLNEEAENQSIINHLWSQAMHAISLGHHETAADFFKTLAEDYGYENVGLYYNWGNTFYHRALREEGVVGEMLLQEGCEKYKKALQYDPNDSQAYYNWGNVLVELALRREGTDVDVVIENAIAKYTAAIEIEPNLYYVYNNWGSALLELGEKKSGVDQIRLFERAKEMFLKAESIKKGTGAYNMACISSLEENDRECERWLKIGEKNGTLPTREFAKNDPDLERIRDKEWYNTIRWQGE